MTIGERIKKARTDAGLSMEQLADRVGVKWQSVQQWERPPEKGKNPTIPRSHRLTSLAKALNVSEDWLLLGRNHGGRNDRQTLHSLIDRLPDRHVPVVETMLLALISDDAEDPQDIARKGA